MYNTWVWWDFNVGVPKEMRMRCINKNSYANNFNKIIKNVEVVFFGENLWIFRNTRIWDIIIFTQLFPF